MTEHSKKAQVDSFLSYFADSPYFLSISADGKMSELDEFRKLCGGYYSRLKEQSVVTLQEKVQVLDKSTVILAWTGSITAYFKNGDIIEMANYTITSVFRKFGGEWKVIHDHESALPPVIIREEPRLI
jgi:ketosteroid isomerase-like protein